MNESRKEQLYKGWKEAVKATQLFAEIGRLVENSVG